MDRAFALLPGIWFPASAKQPARGTLRRSRALLTSGQDPPSQSAGMPMPDRRFGLAGIPLTGHLPSDGEHRPGAPSPGRIVARKDPRAARGIDCLYLL